MVAASCDEEESVWPHCKGDNGDADVTLSPQALGDWTGGIEAGDQRAPGRGLLRHARAERLASTKCADASQTLSAWYIASWASASDPSPPSTFATRDSAHRRARTCSWPRCARRSARGRTPAPLSRGTLTGRRRRGTRRSTSPGRPPGSSCSGRRAGAPHRSSRPECRPHCHQRARQGRQREVLRVGAELRPNGNVSSAH
jgi:hypothetical protein